MKHWTELLMEKLRNKESMRNFAIYFMIACAGVASNLITATYLRRQFNMGFGSSIVIGYLTGGVVGFFLTKTFAFGARNSGNTNREAIKFFMVSLIALTVTWVFSEIFLRVVDFWFGSYPTTQSLLEALVLEITRMINDISGLSISLAFVDRLLICNIGGIGVGFFANFFGHKYFTFKTTGYYDRLKERRKSYARSRSEKIES